MSDMMQLKPYIFVLLLSIVVGGCKGPVPHAREYPLPDHRVQKDDTLELVESTGVIPTGDSLTAHDTVKMAQTGVKAISKAIEKVFSPLLADTLEAFGAKLVVPAGGIENATTLSITPLSSDELPDLPSGMVNVTRGAAGFRFLPHGEHFRRAAATIIIPFDTTLIPAGFSVNDIRTWYFDEATHQWEALITDTIVSDGALAYSYTTHFTDMINGIIQVPHSPEAQGYAPNSITGLQAANPTSGIVVMEPPTAAQSGAAHLSYPFQLPAGRRGMQPSLWLQYNSNKNSGWVGYGWDLTFPAIDIETRWGVPLFDPVIETESYLVMGEQLTHQPHRRPGYNRTADKQFFPRIEGNFSQIVRHGNSPQNYWWEITDKSGTTYSFGGKEGMVNENAVLRNANNNIVQWALLEKRDVSDNFIRYSYNQVGGILYLSEIIYTGHGSTDGPYRIELVRFAPEQATRRDSSTSGRLGLLQADNQQLREVRVYFLNELIRSYELMYKQGVFAKTMLAGVIQKDNEGNNVHTHTFEYYNDVENGMFGDPQEWDTQDEPELHSIFGNGEFTSKMSAINGAHTSGKTFGGGLQVGYGPIPQTAVSAGVSLSFSNNESTGMITLLDINGDGLPDKVFVDGDALYYRPNIVNQRIGGAHFGGRVLLSGMNRFSYSESNSWSKSVQASLGANVIMASGFVGAGASYDRVRSTDRLKNYFHDFNFDGLPDIANNGVVYFNRLNPLGHPKFDTKSAETPNPISGTDISVIDSVFMPDYQAERKLKEEENPLHDVVRVWRAPYSGQVSVAGNIELTATETQWNDDNISPDGITASIQLATRPGANHLLWKDSITAFGDNLVPNPVNRRVNAGDIFLFRLQSRYSGALDEVNWSPSISYNLIYTATDTLDENNLNRHYYSAKSDFVFSGQSSVILAKPGRAQIILQHSKRPLWDDITLLVRQQSALSGEVSDIFRETLPANAQIDNSSPVLNINVASGDTLILHFSILSNSQVDWTGIVWRPSVIYEPFEEEFADTLYAAPEIQNMFNKPIHWAPKQTINTQDSVDAHKGILGVRTEFQISGLERLSGDEIRLGSDTIIVYSPIKALPFLNISQYFEPETEFAPYNLTIRDSLSIFMSYSGIADSDSGMGDTIDIKLDYEGRNVLATFYASVELDSIESAGVKLFRQRVTQITDHYRNDTIDTITVNRTFIHIIECDTIHASVYSVFNRRDIGLLYRGWGQFAWDGTKKGVIGYDDLFYDEAKYKQIDARRVDVRDSTFINSFGDGEPLFAMWFDAERGRYQSITGHAHIGPVFQSSARIGSLEIVLDSINFPTDAGGLAAPVQKTESITHTFSVMGSVLGDGPTFSHSQTTSKSQVSLMDLNGDGYPDWVKEIDGRIESQYTLNTGTLGSKSVTHSIGVTQMKGEANSLSLGPTICHAHIIRLNSPNGNLEKAVAGTQEAKLNPSISGNFSRNHDHAVNEWIDINGDGLPDMVFHDGSV